MARKNTPQLVQTTPVHTLSIANVPEDFLKSPITYLRLDAIWIDHQGLVSFPKAQKVFSCDDAKYVGGDLWLIRQGTWKLVSPFLQHVYYDTGVTDVKHAILIDDLTMLVTTFSNSAFVIKWNLGRSGFTRVDNSNLDVIANASSMAMYQNRLFATVGGTLVWSTPNFKSRVMNNQDPFDLDYGAGMDYYNTNIAYVPKMYILGDNLYLFGLGGMIIIGVKGSANLTLTKYEYPLPGIGDILHVDREYVITSNGLYQLKGTRLQKVDFPVRYFTQNIIGGGAGIYAGTRMYFLWPSAKDYSIVFYPDLGLFGTYPEVVKTVVAWGYSSYALMPQGLCRMFSSHEFHDFYFEFELSLPNEILLHEVLIHGSFGLTNVQVNNKALKVRRAQPTYRRFYSTYPIKSMKPKFNITAKNAVIKRIEVRYHAGRSA